MKKILIILILIFFKNNLSLADSHHHFFICNEVPGGTNWRFELEIDLKKNKAFRDGYAFEIGEKDELYMYAKRKVNKQVVTSFNMNRYTGKLNMWERDEGNISFDCEKLIKQF